MQQAGQIGSRADLKRNGQRVVSTDFSAAPLVAATMTAVLVVLIPSIMTLPACCSYPSEQDEEQQNDHHQTQATAGAISP